MDIICGGESFLVRGGEGQGAKRSACTIDVHV